LFAAAAADAGDAAAAASAPAVAAPAVAAPAVAAPAAAQWGHSWFIMGSTQKSMRPSSEHIVEEFWDVPVNLLRPEK